MTTTQVKCPDILLLGPLFDVTENYYKSLANAAQSIAAKYPNHTVLNVYSLFEDRDVSNYGADEYMRLITATVSQCKVVVTFGEATEEHFSQQIIFIARKLNIPVLSALRVKMDMDREMNWIPEK